MIKPLEITGVHFEVTGQLHQYVERKIAKLDKYLSKHARASVHGEVFLKESKVKDKKSYTCEVILHLPSQTLMCKEAALSMFAAVDIVETKLKIQLKKYKELHGSPKVRLHRRLINRFKHRR